MAIPIWTVDAFTDTPFSGNPAAVCLLDKEIEDSVKQALAAEMNISETCFLTVVDTEGRKGSFKEAKNFNLRWFTPTNEVPLCGHATLSAAAVIFRAAGNNNQILHFQTLSGQLKARRDAQRVVLDLPIHPASPIQPTQFQALVKEVACGLPIKEVVLSEGCGKLLVRLEDFVTRADLKAIRPNTSKFLALENSGAVAGVILTLRAPKGEREHFYSRYFAPWNGISEDPVTGSAHTVLAPYWANILGITNMVASQVSPRGGELHLSLGDSRLEVGGHAVIVLQGSINLGESSTTNANI